ncbi:MAG: hypothetical protein WB868_22415 [Xanthobacteraceae bacterium]
MTRLPRILYAVPPLPHVHLEIAKAIQALAASNDRALRSMTDSRKFKAIAS